MQQQYNVACICMDRILLIFCALWNFKSDFSNFLNSRIKGTPHPRGTISEMYSKSVDDSTNVRFINDTATTWDGTGTLRWFLVTMVDPLLIWTKLWDLDIFWNFQKWHTLNSGWTSLFFGARLFWNFEKNLENFPNFKIWTSSKKLQVQDFPLCNLGLVNFLDLWKKS